MTNVIITENNIEEYVSDLDKVESVEQIRQIVDDLVQSRSIGDAYRFSNTLGSVLTKADVPDEKRRIYSEFMLQLKFIALPMLEDHEQKTLLSKHLLYAFRHGIDLKDRIHFIFFPYFRGRDDLIKLSFLLKAIEENEELIGEQELHLVNSKTARPTVGNWLLDYKLSSRDQSEEGLSSVTYFMNNQNAKALSEEDKGLLREVVSLYDWLRFKAIPRDILGQSVSAGAGGTTYLTREKIIAPPPPPVAPRPKFASQISVAPAVVPKVIIPPPPPVPQPPVKPKEPQVPLKPTTYNLQPITPKLPPAQRPPMKKEFGDRSWETGAKEPARAALPTGRIISEEPMTPRTSSLNEDLYRSTLDELKKQREEREPKISVSTTLTEAKIQSTPPEFDPQISVGQGQQKPVQPQPSRIEKPEIPKKPGFDENLYQSTLDELNKIRQAYERKPEARSTKHEAREEIQKRGSPPSNLPQGPAVSVNEALVRAGDKEPSTGQGQMVAGSEDAVEKKLKELEKKVK